MSRDSNGSAVAAALARSADFEVTIADMARKSERRAWHVAIGSLLMALILAGGYFYFLPLKEQVPFLVMADANDGLKQLGRSLGFDGEGCFVNAAGCIAAQAKAAGLGRVDHVLQDNKGRGLAAVQGRIDDPGSLWIQVDRGLATLQPIQLSTIQADLLQEQRSAERRLGREMGASIGR